MTVRLVGKWTLFLLFPHQFINIFGAENESICYTDFAVKTTRIFLCLLPVFMGLDGVLLFMPIADILTAVASVIVIVNINKALGRPAYYNQRSANRWGEAVGYDLCIDTDWFGIDGAVSLISDCARHSVRSSIHTYIFVFAAALPC